MPPAGDPVAPVRARAGWIGLTGAVVLIAVAALLPPLTGLDVHNDRIAPLRAYFAPVFGPRSVTHSALGSHNPAFGLAAVTLAGMTALAVWRWAERLAGTMRWARLLAATWLAGGVWTFALAAVRGRRGLTGPLASKDEYLGTARNVDNISEFLHGFVARINQQGGGNWPVHVAGHPPGIVLFFTLLHRIHLGGGLAVGLVVLVLGATTPLAVLITLRRLRVEGAARRVAPLLTFGPAAIWTAVSADAVIAVATTWGVGLLTVAATASRPRAGAAWGVLAGLVLGISLYLSYGMVIMALPCLAVLLAARCWRPVPWALLGVAVVVVVFTAGGFSWWEAYPVLRARYYAGAAAHRPTGYWVWADLAAFAVGAGPAVGGATAAVASGARRVRDTLADRSYRPIFLLAGAGVACVLLADLSLMSKAEVERIWLPFAPWVLAGCALLPRRWRRVTLAVQLLLALLVELTLHTYW